MTCFKHTKLYFSMRLKRIAKGAVKNFRIVRVRACAGLRAVTPLRRMLNLPANEIAALPVEWKRHPAVLCDAEKRQDAVSTLQAIASGHLVMRPVDAAEPFTRPMPFLPGEHLPPEPLVRAQSGVCPATFVVEIQGGRFWSFYGGSAFTRDGRIIHEISKDVWGPRLHTAYTRASLPKPVRLPGRTLSLVTPEAANNYHHWTIDCVSRAGLVQRAGYRLSDFDQVLVKHRGSAFQREAFERLGISPRKLVRVGEQEYFETETLVVPAIRHDNTAVNRADMRFVRRLYLPVEPARASARRRLYVGRRDAAFRRVTNEDEIMPLLRRHGFEEVAMSRMSVAEQARLFSEAEIIVGPNGSALANLVFANPACRVIEFFAPGWIVPYNWMIGANLGLDYTVLIGDGPRPAAGELPREVKQDIELDVGQLEKALEFSIFDSRFSIGGSRSGETSESRGSAQSKIENRESKI